MKMSDATKGVEARLDGLEAQLKATNWLLGFIGVLIAITGLAPAMMKLF